MNDAGRDNMSSTSAPHVALQEYWDAQQEADNLKAVAANAATTDAAAAEAAVAAAQSKCEEKKRRFDKAMVPVSGSMRGISKHTAELIRILLVTAGQTPQAP